MGAPSVHGCPVQVPWQGILLAASLLTFWTPSVTAKPTVEPEPPDASEGQDVLLRVRDLPGYFGIYSWYKGGKADNNQRIASYNVATLEFSNGPAHSGREIMYPNMSLLFKNVTQADTGEYTLRYLNISRGLEEVTGQLRVYPVLPKPHITSNNSDPVEHKDPVALTCGPETQDTTYLWSIRGQSPPDGARLQLSPDNRTLTLLRVTRNDTGPYVCETRNPASAQRSDPLALNVLYGPDTPTISPSRNYYSTGANLSLSCLAASHPPAQYSWLVNGRPQQASQELSIPHIAESDSGAYTCLAHNKATGLSSTTVKNITVSGEWLPGPSAPSLGGAWWFRKEPARRAESREGREAQAPGPFSVSHLPCFSTNPVALPSIQASNATEHKDPMVLTCVTGDPGISTPRLPNNQRLRSQTGRRCPRTATPLSSAPSGGRIQGVSV
ncbi:Carcinoembryonic antigen-related cell adhesion molecule 1 [Galemys pyrenaicus]|uniref:Carcinoembryonic antigen-related cell adhesion molecule 1 n=1 Tax=Galemys pyrenaicus TaxID=202257 RepID=A0A8J6AH88_GALPY|nr:Carcinoembryonic antigen-related cell adhesion molecule 1 [Galemys pyrenaicus]